MAPIDKPSQPSSARRDFGVTYTQRDVETIREQIQEEQAAKRRLLFLALIVTAAALVGAIFLLSTSYALYSRSQSAKERLGEDNASLRSQGEECKRLLDTARAKEEKANQIRVQAQEKLDKILPSALASGSGGREAALLAQMVFQMPEHMVELARKPPDTLFRNWRISANAASDTYTLVGGFVDGKWVIYSNLVARRRDSEE
jgi:hypothetical protein